MSMEIARATQLREEARLAEEQGNIDRAEVLYVESKEIFLQNGGTYLTDTAIIMNEIASMKEKYGDHAGALRAAEKSLQILINHEDPSTSRKADEIRIQAWLIIGRIQRQLARYGEAQEILLQALNHAVNVFGEIDEQTISIREQLAMLKS